MEGKRDKRLTGDDVEDMDLWKDHFENKATYAALVNSLRDWSAKAQCMGATIETQAAEIARLTAALEAATKCNEVRAMEINILKGGAFAKRVQR